MNFTVYRFSTIRHTRDTGLAVRKITVNDAAASASLFLGRIKQHDDNPQPTVACMDSVIKNRARLNNIYVPCSLYCDRVFTE